MVFQKTNIIIEIAKSSRSTCHLCGDQIHKGRPRMGVGDYTGSYEFFCEECAKEILKERLKQLKEMIKNAGVR
jgi:ribosomal protein L24E